MREYELLIRRSLVRAQVEEPTNTREAAGVAANQPPSGATLVPRLVPNQGTTSNPTIQHPCGLPRGAMVPFGAKSGATFQALSGIAMCGTNRPTLGRIEQPT